MGGSRPDFKDESPKELPTRHGGGNEHTRGNQDSPAGRYSVHVNRSVR
jgi:hypothetical protein